MAGERLIGVGVGPGDPEYVTVKAINALTHADVILVPATETSAGSVGRAEEIVLAACPQVAGRIQRVPFSMRRAAPDGGPAGWRESWQAGADAVLAAFASGAGTVAFATIGDPSVYSTFSYLRATVAAAWPSVGFELIPGITAMQALAAVSGTPLVEGNQTLALVPATAGVHVVGAVLDACDSVVIYKGGRIFAELRHQLAERGRDAVIGVDVSLPGQQLHPLHQTDPNARFPYFATVLSTPRHAGAEPESQCEFQPESSRQSQFESHLESHLDPHMQSQPKSVGDAQ